MTHPAYLRDKARQMRAERRLTIDEIAERLALSRTTVYHWVRDLPPIERRGRPQTAGQLKGSLAMQRKYRQLREAAYAEGRSNFDLLARDATFRDFVSLYLAEGYKRNLNCVSVGNSDPAVVQLCTRWLRRLSSGRMDYAVQYHADQDLEELRRFG
jgi:AcrR family transcriptional regulator